MASEVLPGSPQATLGPMEAEVVDFMVRLFRLMGLPKTIGSIYGFLYASRRPVSMEEVTQALGISLGSASQGLRTLKVFRGVRPVYSQGERREFFEAETDFGRFVGVFLRGELEQYIDNTEKRTQRMNRFLDDLSDSEERSFFEDRIRRLASMSERAKRIVPLIDEVFAPRDTP